MQALHEHIAACAWAAQTKKLLRKRIQKHESAICEDSVLFLGSLPKWHHALHLLASKVAEQTFHKLNCHNSSSDEFKTPTSDLNNWCRGTFVPC